jgi:hypothetical protein
MTNVEIVQERVAKFLKSPEPEVLCISGEWGVGKTYLWTHQLRSAASAGEIALKTYSYVSLFGLNNLESVKRTIFESSSSVLDHSAVPIAPQISNNPGPLYFASVRGQIICVDDMERRDESLTMKGMLGLISVLKEERSCKVVLILNDDQLGPDDEKEWRAHFEKVVDEHLIFAPGAQDAARIALRADDEVTHYLRANCVSLGISNIRVIKKIEKFARNIEAFLSDKNLDPGVLKQAVQTITLLGWSTFQPKHAPSLEFITTRRGSSYVPKGAQIDPKEAQWNSMLDDYLFRMLDEFDGELLKLIETGYYDKEKLATQARRLSESYVAKAQNNAFEDAWKLYHERSDGDVADLANFIRRSWGNEAPAVSIEAVKALRSSTDSASDHVIILRMR